MKKPLFINSLILIAISILLLSTQVEKEQEVAHLTGAVKASYFALYIKNDLFYSFALIILSVLFIIIQKSRFRFENGVFLVAANIAIFASYLCALYNLFFIPIMVDYDFIQTVEEGAFNSSKLMNLSIVMVFTTMILLIRCWSNSLKSYPQTKSKLSFIILILITIIIYNRLNGIKLTNVHIEKTIEKHKIAVKESLILTEERTERNVKENPNSWSAHFMRAQFLWETGRTKESTPYYKKSLELLGTTEDELSKFIKERLSLN